jgi:fatty acid desaturase
MKGETTGQEFRIDGRRPRGSVRRGGDHLEPHELEPLVRLDDARSIASVLVTIVPLAATLTVALVLWTWWVVLLALPIIAAQQHAMFVLVHESAHYRLFTNRRLNDAVGRTLAALVGISMCTYRVVHRLHHNHLLSDLDPDIALNGGYPRGKAYLLKKLAIDLSGLTAWKTYKYFFGAPAANAKTQTAQRPLDDTAPALRRAALSDRRTVVAVQVVLPLVVLAFAGTTGLAKYAVLWLLPALTLLQAMLRLRAIAEHGAPPATDSPFSAARTNLVNPLLRFFLFPHHVGYHIEHHLYPAVPHYRLPVLHELLRRRGALDQAEVRHFDETWELIYAECLPPAPRRG